VNLAMVILMPAVVGCGGRLSDVSEPPTSIRLTSEVFTEGGEIPKRYTCDGEGVSPPLAWFGVPELTKSLALLVDDPDAPGGEFAHWIVYDLDAGLQGLPEGVRPEAEGMTQGRNDFGKIGYGAPCPPRGTHRYVFTVYALRRPIEWQIEHPPNRAEFLKAIQRLVLAQGVLTGTYQR
jgi:Raf kinase inhibitor-like YbhB/YbcL family protein